MLSFFTSNQSEQLSDSDVREFIKAGTTFAV